MFASFSISESFVRPNLINFFFLRRRRSKEWSGSFPEMLLCFFFTFHLTRVLKKCFFFVLFSLLFCFSYRVWNTKFTILKLWFFFSYLFLSYQLYLFSRSLNNLIFFLQFDCAIVNGKRGGAEGYEMRIIVRGNCSLHFLLWWENRGTGVMFWKRFFRLRLWDFLEQFCWRFFEKMVFNCVFLSFY